MSPPDITAACRVGVGVACTVGPYVVARGFARAGTYPGRELVGRYTSYLDRTLKLLFIKTPARKIVRIQAVVFALGLAALVVTRESVAVVVSIVALAFPSVHYAAERSKRRASFDLQADGFILALANSLKAVPSIGAALQGIMPVLNGPMKQEMGVVLSELRLGNTIDQALVNASARAESVPFDSAVSALLVGRQVGGNLPKILESTATSIREMNRLAGNLRSKTAESRAQLWVLAIFPIGIIFAFRLMKPDYFTPLQTTDLGHLCAGVAVVLWAMALLLARKISQVDL